VLGPVFEPSFILEFGRQLFHPPQVLLVHLPVVLVLPEMVAPVDAFQVFILFMRVGDRGLYALVAQKLLHVPQIGVTASHYAKLPIVFLSICGTLVIVNAHIDMICLKNTHLGGIMKKLLIIALVLLLSGTIAFAQEGEIIFRGAAGIMYFNELAGYVNFAYSGFRGGVHGDIMYNLGQFEAGVEIGLYIMEIEKYYYWDYYYFFAVEIPVNVILRMNFDKNRTLAIEGRGGLWLHMFMNDWWTVTDLTFNIGGRVALSFFYIGVDYVFGSEYYYPGVAIEAGVKIAFD
jgi:hypothetical protein